MRKLLQVAVAWAALVAWLAASGVSADILQVFAYAGHVASHGAIQEEAPCGLCLTAEMVRHSADKTPVAKQEPVKAKAKSDNTVWSVRLSPAAPDSASIFREVAVSVFCPELICEVPVPPPKTNA